MTDVTDHHAVLRREWERIAAITDAAYNDMGKDTVKEGHVSKLLEARYKDWAGLLLRFHDAIERISKGEEGVDLPPMKAGL